MAKFMKVLRFTPCSLSGARRETRGFSCPGREVHRLFTVGPHTRDKNIVNASLVKKLHRSMRARIPVFTLPGVVLFPNSTISLHIFEMRYREILLNSEAEDSSGEIGCIARVVQAVRRPDGRSDIVAVGGDRAIIKNYYQYKPYLLASYSTLHDDPIPRTQSRSVTALRSGMNQLSVLVRRVYKKDLQCTFSDDVDAEELSFIAAGMLDLDAAEQQRILITESTCERIDMLLPKIHLHNKELAAMAAIESAFGV